MNRTCFIYSITNIKTGIRYIGSSINIESRWHNHKSHLKHNKHHSGRLQRAWNRDGPKCFSFEILQEMPGSTWEERLKAEINWISKFKTYNSRTANVFLTNFENSPETRQKIKEGVANSAAIQAYRKTHSGRMKQIWSDPENRKVFTTAIRKSRQDPKARSRQSKIMAKAWKDPKRRKQLLNRTYSEATLLSKAEKMRAYWATPEAKAAKERQKRAVQEYWAKRRLSQ